MALRDLPFVAMGGQPAFEPAALERFVAAPRIAVLAYTRASGRPAQVPIWYDYTGGAFDMISTSTSPKVRALGREPRAALTIQDERPPYRAVIIDGTVTLEALDGQSESDALAVRYFGRVGAAEYAKMTAEEYAHAGLTRMHLVPERVRGFDNTRLLSAPVLAWIRLRNVLPLPMEWV